MTYSAWTDAQDSTTVTVDGYDLDVAYYEDGERNDDPVLFLHGIPTNSYLWRHAVGAIAEERHVVAPDMVGYGNSSMFDGFDRSLRAQEVMIDELTNDFGFQTCRWLATTSVGAFSSGTRVTTRRRWTNSCSRTR